MLAIVPSMDLALPRGNAVAGGAPIAPDLSACQGTAFLGPPRPDHGGDVAVALPVAAMLVPGPLRFPDDVGIVRGEEVRASTVGARCRSQVVEVALLVAASGCKLVLHGPHPNHLPRAARGR